MITVETASPKGRVLIMDDEELICDILLQALSRSGYEVCSSSNGAEAIELYRLAKQSGRPFHALIIDLCIKNGMDGLETISRLMDIDPDVKAIVISGSPDHPVMLNHGSYGFSGILPKPFLLEKLRAELDKIMQQQRGRYS